jgi:hypothetical protein
LRGHRSASGEESVDSKMEKANRSCHGKSRNPVWPENHERERRNDEGVCRTRGGEGTICVPLSGVPH